jgi:hypothetical protein
MTASFVVEVSFLFVTRLSIGVADEKDAAAV